MTVAKDNGIYCFHATDKIVVPASVIGLSFTHGWKEVEAVDGVFDWSAIDKDLAYAHAQGKRAMLRIYFGRSCPQWVMQQCPTITAHWQPGGPMGAQVTTMPIPWTTAFISRVTAFTAAFGAKYDGDSRIARVALAGCGWLGEMAMPHPWAGWTSHTAPPDGCGPDVYTDAKLIHAWQTIIAAGLAAFKTTPVTLAIDGTSGIQPTTMNVTRLREAIVAPAIASPRKVSFQFNGLRATTSPHTADREEFAWAVASGGYVGCQQYQGGNTVADLHTMFNAAIALKVRFVEVYTADVLNPTAAAELTRLAAGIA